MNDYIYLCILNGIVKKEFTTQEGAVTFTTKQPINYNIKKVNKKTYNNYKKILKNISNDPKTCAFNKMMFEEKAGIKQ